MRQRILAGIVTLLSAGVVCHGSQAAIIAYAASGTLSNSGGLGPPPFPNGTPISIQFSIDAATPDSAALDSNLGIYSGLTGTFTLGAETYLIDSYGYRSVEVINDFNYAWGFGDQVLIRLSTSDYSSLVTPVYNGARIHNLTLALRPANSSTTGNPDGTVFASDALGNSIGLNLGALPQSAFFMQLGNLVYINSDTNGPVAAFSSTLVPLPAALWLLGSALGVLSLARRCVSWS